MRRGALVALVAAGVLLASCGDGGSGESHQRPESLPSNDVLRRDPYMGVACPTPNAIACDRVGLSIDLEEPARAVTASIAGMRFELDDPGWSGRLEHGERRRFAGFLQPAGLSEPGPLQVATEESGQRRWIGRGPVFAPVRLLIVDASGERMTTHLRVGLAPGWG